MYYCNFGGIAKVDVPYSNNCVDGLDVNSVLPSNIPNE